MKRVLCGHYQLKILKKKDSSQLLFQKELLKGSFYFSLVYFSVSKLFQNIAYFCASTGRTIQARSSYCANDFLWGYRFEKLVTFQKTNGEYQIDYSKFNMTFPLDTPLCSARGIKKYFILIKFSFFLSNIFIQSKFRFS